MGTTDNKSKFTSHDEKCHKIVNGHQISTSSNSNNSSSCSSNNHEEVPALPIYIDQKDILAGAREVIQQIRPNWKLEFVEFKVGNFI